MIKANATSEIAAETLHIDLLPVVCDIKVKGQK